MRLVEEAKQELDGQDDEILSTLREPFTVIGKVPHLFAYPLWRYGGISGEFIQYGRKGILAAWAYLHFQLKHARQDRWYLSIAKNSLDASRQANAATVEWLRARNFPPELCVPFLRGE